MSETPKLLLSFGGWSVGSVLKKVFHTQTNNYVLVLHAIFFPHFFCFVCFQLFSVDQKLRATKSKEKFLLFFFFSYHYSYDNDSWQSKKKKKTSLFLLFFCFTLIFPLTSVDSGEKMKWKRKKTVFFSLITVWFKLLYLSFLRKKILNIPFFFLLSLSSSFLCCCFVTVFVFVFTFFFFETTMR